MGRSWATESKVQDTKTFSESGKFASIRVCEQTLGVNFVVMRLENLLLFVIR